VIGAKGTKKKKLLSNAVGILRPYFTRSIDVSEKEGEPVLSIYRRSEGAKIGSFRLRRGRKRVIRGLVKVCRCWWGRGDQDSFRGWKKLGDFPILNWYKGKLIGR